MSVLVIGIGNPDRGDDAAGLDVARLLAELALPGVRVLEAPGDALALLDRWAGADRVVLVDAAGPMGRPGRIHRLDAIAAPLPRDLALGSTHAFGLAQTVELARTLGQLPPRLVVYAIEGTRFDTGAALSAPVAEAVAVVAGRIAAELTEGVAHA